MARFGRGYIQRPLYVKHRQSIYAASLSSATAQADMSASVVQQPNKFLSAAIAPSDSKLIFFFYQILIANIVSNNFFGLLFKQSNIKFYGSINSSGLLQTVKTIILGLIASISSSNVNIFNTNKLINGNINSNSSDINKFLFINLSSSFVIANLNALLLKSTSKSFTAIFGGLTIIQSSIANNINKTFISSTIISGNIFKQIQNLFNSNIFSTSTNIFNINKYLTSSVDSSSNIIKLITTLLNSYINLSSINTNFINKFIFASINSIGIFTKKLFATLGGSILASGNIFNVINKIINGLVESNSKIIKNINKYFNGILINAGTLYRVFSRFFNSDITFSKNVIRKRIPYNPAQLKEIIVSIIDFVINTFITSKATSSIEDMSITTSIIENNQTQVQDMSISTEIVDNTTAELYQERG